MGKSKNSATTSAYGTHKKIGALLKMINIENWYITLLWKFSLIVLVFQ